MTPLLTFYFSAFGGDEAGYGSGEMGWGWTTFVVSPLAGEEALASKLGALARLISAEADRQ